MTDPKPIKESEVQPHIPMRRPLSRAKKGVAKAGGDPHRDEAGRYKKGSPGGPGRPTLAREREYLNAFMQAMSPERLRALVLKIQVQALKGCLHSQALLLKYLVPPATQRIEINGPGVDDLDDRIDRLEALHREFDERLRQADRLELSVDVGWSSPALAHAGANGSSGGRTKVIDVDASGANGAGANGADEKG